MHIIKHITKINIIKLTLHIAMIFTEIVCILLTGLPIKSIYVVILLCIIPNISIINWLHNKAVEDANDMIDINKIVDNRK